MAISHIVRVPYNPLKRTIVSSDPQRFQETWGMALQDLSAFRLRWKGKIDAMIDGIAQEIRAAKATALIQAEEKPEVSVDEWIQSHLDDKHPDNYPACQMIEELLPEIVERKTSALILRKLLALDEAFRMNFGLFGGLNPDVDVLIQQRDAAIHKIAQAVHEDLSIWEMDNPISEREINWYRPANVYRRYGLALRYAVEELGSFEAKRALNRLMLSVTLPVNELEAPDWIDGYTGEVDQSYEFLRMRAVKAEELSSDGITPATLADLLENLGAEGRATFEKDLQALGMDAGDYWAQFLEAQRSGFTMAPEFDEVPEPDESGFFGHREYTDEDGEKDFEFKADLMVDKAATDAIESEMKDNLKRIRVLIAQTAREVSGVRRVENALKVLDQVINQECPLAYREVTVTRWIDKGEYVTEKVNQPYRPALQKAATGAVKAQLEAALNELTAEIAFVRDRYEIEFPDGAAFAGDVQNLPFKYPVDLNKVSLGYIQDLLARKVKMVFGVTWEIARARFYTDKKVVELIRRFNEWAMSKWYEPKDLMAVLNPYQNAFGFNEDDLLRFRVPTKWGGTLYRFMEEFGEVYLEQFITGGGAGIVPSADPDGDELEHWTNDLVAERKRVYLSPRGAREWRKTYRETEGTMAEKKAAADSVFNAIYAEDRKAEIERIKALGLKPNVRNNREFIEAEVEAALMGDGAADGPQQAGWDAYRMEIDPHANRVFKKAYAEVRKAGKSPSECNRAGMDAFKAQKEANRNRIVNATKTGLVLASGRAIDWGIAKLKFEKNEIPFTLDDLQRLMLFLINNRIAPWFLNYLKTVVERTIQPQPAPAKAEGELEEAPFEVLVVYEC